jgi:hypothetical protein
MIRPLHNILRPGLHNQLSKLVSQSREVSRLNAILQDCLPATLVAHCQVANHQDQKLVLTASSSAYASKLRYLIPEIKQQFKEQLNITAAIHIKVAVMNTTHSSPQPSRRLTMTPEAAKVIAETAVDINDTKLQAALLRLARHGQTA